MKMAFLIIICLPKMGLKNLTPPNKMGMQRWHTALICKGNFHFGIKGLCRSLLSITTALDITEG